MTKLWPDTCVPNIIPSARRISKKTRVREFVAARGWTAVGESEWLELRTALPDISESTLRSAGIPIAQPWLGVLQHSLDELQSSLSGLSAVYASRADLQRYTRAQVIRAKDRARWLSKSSRTDLARLALKQEMVEWMLRWLDDPAIFDTWVRVRRLYQGRNQVG